MKVILFGATGMVGQGVLRECLLDPGVESVLAVGRSPTGQRHAKLREILHDNFMDYSAIESRLTGYDACDQLGQTQSADGVRLCHGAGH
jgi:putative NADH-flavin reductase